MKVVENTLKGTYYVTSPFGMRGDEFHKGTDYGTNSKKIEVYALESGEVQISKSSTSAGEYVQVYYPRIKKYVRYLHLDSRKVAVGDNVEKGTLLGYVGTTGQSTGIHLHLDIRSNSNYTVQSSYVDPEVYDYQEEVVPTPEPSGNSSEQVTNKHGEVLKVNDVVVPTSNYNYKGTKVVQYDKSYVITEFNSENYERAVLKAKRGNELETWAGMHIDDIKKI